MLALIEAVNRCVGYLLTKNMDFCSP